MCMQFFHKVLKINNLRTVFRPKLCCSNAFLALICVFLGMTGLILSGCSSEAGGACAENTEYEPMLYSKMLRLGKSCGRDVAEIRSVVGRDTLIKKFVFLSKDSVEEGEEKKWGGYTVLRVPLERVIPLSSAQIGFLSMLGVEFRIVGVGSGQYIVDNTLYGRVLAGVVTEVGSGPTIMLEKVVSANPDLVLTFATGGGEDDYKRLESIGVPLMLTSEWQEESPLAKFEWIKLYGKLFRESYGEFYFEQSKKSYGKMLEKFKTEIDSGAAKPRVLAGMSYGGVWYAPGGRSYTAQLIRDAGGRYLWESDTSREMKLSLEEVFTLADSADVWVNPGMFSTAAEIYAAEPRVKKIRAFKTGRICQNDGRKGIGGGNDFYEGAVVQPVELVWNLHDCLFYEKMGNSGVKKALPSNRWYRNIYNF